MATVYNLITNPSFISDTTGWQGYVTGTKTGLVASALVSGTTSVTLTTGNTSGMSVGQRVYYTSGTGAFGGANNSSYIVSIENTTQFTVSDNHATSGSITFSTGTTPSLSLDNSDPLYGTGYSARITAVDTSPYVGLLFGGNDYKIPIVVGETYSFSAYVKVPAGQPAAYFSLRAYYYTQFSGGTNTFVNSSPVKLTSHDGWQRLTFTFEVPSTNSWIYFGAFVFRNQSEAYTANSYFLVDGVQFQTGSEVTPLIYNQGQKNKLVDTALARKYIDHLVGMKLGADIRLGDFVFNRIDEYGVVWVVSDVEGWWNLPQVEMQDLPRGWGDGSYTTYGRYGSRQLTITGSFILQDPDTQLEAARERLIKAINLVKQDAWLILDEDTPKALKVRLSGTPSIGTINPRGRTDFSIGLVAADPIKYKWADARDDGYALTTANSNAEVVTIRNDGNTPVSAIFEIIGPTTGPVSLFNRTSEQLLDVIYKLDKYKVFTVTGAQVSNGNMTFTTNTTHGLSAGDSVDVLNVVDIFDISSIVCTSANTVDVTTSVKHNFSVDQRLYLTGLSGLTGYSNVTNNEYYITNVYAGTDDYKFRITRSGLVQSVVGSQTASNAKFAVWSNLSSIAYTADNSTAVVTTAAGHGFDVGDQIILSNTSVVFNGTYTVAATPSNTTFELIFSESQTVVPITYYESTLELGTIRFSSGALSAVANDYVTIQTLNEDFNGTYKVFSSNSTAITFNKSFQNVTDNTASTFGTVYISKLVDRSSTSYTSGRAYYGNIYNGYYTVDSVSTSTPTQFTITRPTYYSNVSNATITTYDGATSPVARVYAETLSIDTYTKDIALNGEIGGYRSKLDTVVDWIQLQPGDNEVIFEDLNKNFVSNAAFTVVTGLVATLSTGTNSVTLTTGSTTNLTVGSRLTKTSGTGVFGNSGEVYITAITNATAFTVGLVGGTAVNHDTSGSITFSGHYATLVTASDHNFVVGSQIKLIGLDTISGGSNVFANASTATVATVPDTKSFTFGSNNITGASNISSTAVTSGYIYEISSAYVNIYYRSGWIG